MRYLGFGTIAGLLHPLRPWSIYPLIKVATQYALRRGCMTKVNTSRQSMRLKSAAYGGTMSYWFF